MGKNKNKQQTQQQQQSYSNNTYGFLNVPETADIKAVRDFQPQIDPSISYSFARARNDLKNRFDNPLGADTPAAVRDAIQWSGERELQQEEAQKLREAADDLNNRELSKRLAVAGLTDPKLVQTGGTAGGTSNGMTMTNSGGGLGGFLSGAAGIGLAL